MSIKKAILVLGHQKYSRIKRVNEEKLKSKYDLILLTKKANIKNIPEEVLSDFKVVIGTNFTISSISKNLRPYLNSIELVMAFGEENVKLLGKVAPHLPYLYLPTSESIRWSTNKILMRQRFEEYNPSMTPQFFVADDYTADTISKIEKKVAYPLVVKPTNMATSKFVTKCYHREELEKALSNVFKKSGILQQIKQQLHYDAPENNQVIIEEYMEGRMYSIDGLVDDKGSVHQYPLVHVLTGKEAGFDDFFGYRRITPVKANEQRQKEARELVEETVRALKLKNVPFHCELMRLEEGWKVVEVSPRQGGYREKMYKLSYDIDITHNEVLLKLGKNIKTNESFQGYTAVLQIFPRKEGRVKSITGIRKIQGFETFVDITQGVSKGERVRFAKNGGTAVLTITLHNNDRSLVLADIRRVESEVEINLE